MKIICIGRNYADHAKELNNAVPSEPVLKTRTFPFTSRTPSGTVYAPDLSAYNNSSLFNYAGPGGLAEYTYGQGLRTDGADYSIFGSPANIAASTSQRWTCWFPSATTMLVHF